MDGKMLVVVYADYLSRATLVATHEISTQRIHLFQVPEGLFLRPIWTHVEFLRFATAKRGSITIWQAEFTLTHPPEAVESFPAPDEIANANEDTQFLFLPSHSRLAIPLVDTLSVWDARDSKLLLTTDGSASSCSFSSDGCFFACAYGAIGEVNLWKESPAGYVLHQSFAAADPFTQPCLSPNGESILISTDSKIHLRHTKYPIIPNCPSLEMDLTSFILGFSPDDLSAAFARLWGETVTVLDLQSGDPQLEIETDLGVRGLGVTGSAIVVVGQDEVGTWSLTAGEAGVKYISDIVQKKTLDFSQSRFVYNSTLCYVSSDLSRIALPGYNEFFSPAGLDIYNAFTGSYLTGVQSGVLKISSLPMLFRLLM